MRADMEPLHGSSQQPGDPWLMKLSGPNRTAYATLSYAHRWWALGVRPEPGLADQVGPYKGHGWRDRLERDAEAALERLLASEEAEA